MEIVPTSTPKKKESGLEELIIRKAALKLQIQDQRRHIAASTKQLLSPELFSSYIFSAFHKSLNVFDGIMIGYKIVRSIRRIFRK